MRIFWVAAALIAAVPAQGQTAPMTAEAWTLEGAARFASIEGQAAVQLGPPAGEPLKSGAAAWHGPDFATGTIEFDMLLSGTRDFAGISFRGDEAGNGELFYVRPHMNGRPDSTQYTPVVNGSLAWQIFSGPGFISQVDLPVGRWAHVRLDVYARSALVSIDGKPALRIPHLKSERTSGGIGLNAVGGTCFANFSVRPIADYRDPEPIPAEPALAAEMVKAWHVSPAMAETDANMRATRSDWAGIGWSTIAAETNGIANLSRAGPDAPGRNSYVARVTLHSDRARSAAMRFGFSDSVQVYLNGRLLYEGDDQQASRDYRFLGIVGLWDKLYLPLERGANQLVFVVTDGTNGGTAAAARFDAIDGLRVE